jgi:hypothetical protein
MTVPTLYQGEAKIRRVTYSSTQGASVALELPDMDAMHAFLGSEGKRLMLVAVLVGDDEQPVPPKKASEPRKRSARAFLMTQDPSFQRYASVSSEWEQTADGADMHIKWVCGINSKSELDTDEEAATEFEALCTKFNHWMESRR